MQLFEKAPTKAELLAYIDTQHSPVKVGTICAHFEIVCPTPERRKGSAYSQVRSMLRELVREGQVARRQFRPRGWHWYHSVPRLVESVQEEQEQTVAAGPAITLGDLKDKAIKCDARRRKLTNERQQLEQQIEQECTRLEVLLSLIDPFDENFRLGLH